MAETPDPAGSPEPEFEWVPCARARVIHAMTAESLRAKFRGEKNYFRAKCRSRLSPAATYWGGYPLCPGCVRRLPGVEPAVPVRGAHVLRELRLRYDTQPPPTPAGGLCECDLSLEPPPGVKWWRPDLDIDPGPSVQAVARCGESAGLRRAVRRDDGAGWSEFGAMVNYYHDITPPMPWEQVGDCWAERHHPVVAVRFDPIDGWVVDA